MKRKNKYGINKNKWNNKSNKFLNNKKYRNDIIINNSNIVTSVKKESIIDNNSVKENYVYDIPGYYYDKEKKRYFLLDQFNLDKSNIKNKKEEIKVKETKKEKSILSNFNIIRSCKLKDKKLMKKYYDRVKSLRESNFIKLEYEGDKLPNSIYLFYLKKYLLILDYFNPNINNNTSFTNILIHDVINNKFIKKIIIEEFYNDFIIKKDNLILIDNIAKLTVINNINKIIEAKDRNIIIEYSNKFNIKIDNIERISMVYKWPFININNNNTYYYLIWNSFFSFDLDDINKSNITNSEIIYFTKSQIMRNKNNPKINKINIDKKHHYINFFIYSNTHHESSKFYFFTVNGEIHCYKFNKNRKFKLKQIITNEALNNIQIVNISPFKTNYNYLIISNQNIIFDLNLKNQTVTKISLEENNENKNIKYKMKIFEYNEDINCLIYDEDKYIKILSLDDFTIIEQFLYNDYKYNILTTNNDFIII